MSLFLMVCGKRPHFRVDGGSPAENLALQNIQVRGEVMIGKAIKETRGKELIRTF